MKNSDNKKQTVCGKKLKQKLTQDGGKITPLNTSTSWRITAPLRKAVQFVRKCRDVSRVTAYSLRQDKILLIRKTVLILKNEGLSGIRKRVREKHKHLNQYTDNGSILPHFLKTFPRCSIAYDGKGNYSLTTKSGGYIYIEPQPPGNLIEQIDALKTKITFSIIVPVYNTPPDILGEMLSSVYAQWYPDWELTLVDDASPNQEIRQLLQDINHQKVKVIFSEKNSGISCATNIGLQNATGDFIVFLDHDDTLTVDCLFELAKCINEDNPDFIYSDEDKLLPNGTFTEPHFKPAWSPDTLMSTMYTCHVSCVRRSMLDKVGMLNSEYDGCQDWDFILRLTEKTSNISHIPKVLYHWRVIPQSIAANISAKKNVETLTCKMKEEALKRRGQQGTIEPIPNVPGYFRVNYHIQSNPLISIIIPTRDNASVLKRCIESIDTLSTYQNYEIIVIDNGSVSEESLNYFEKLQKTGKITVIQHDIPFNFSELCNLGADKTSGELLLFLNDDTEVITPDWLERMAGYAQLPHIGAVGAKLLYPGGEKIQHAGLLNLESGPGHAFWQEQMDTPGYFMRKLLEYNWIAVTGACLMIEKNKFNALGKFCEDMPIAYNDVEICFRLLKNNLYNVVCQAAQLIHHESLSRGIDLGNAEREQRLQKERLFLYNLHPDYYQNDPFYSPNIPSNSVHFLLQQ